MAASSKIAVIGAGLAGLTCAVTLSNQNAQVQVFDKARGPGGRFSSRRRLDAAFDLGCQAITASHPDFVGQLKAWQQQGWIAPLDPPESGFAGVPRMSALTRHLSEGLDLKTSTRIVKIEKTPAQEWQLLDDQGRTWGPFGSLVVATPAQQALALVKEISIHLYQQLQSVQEAPVWVAYFAFEQASSSTPAFMQPAAGALSRISHLNAKPGQTSGLERWVVEATPEWSQAHLELPADQVAQQLFEFWQELMPEAHKQPPLLLEAHRWLYARATQHLNLGYLADPDKPLFVCGDFCQGSDAEAAWLSGRHLGNALHKAIQ